MEKSCGNHRRGSCRMDGSCDGVCGQFFTFDSDVVEDIRGHVGTEHRAAMVKRKPQYARWIDLKHTGDVGRSEKEVVTSRPTLALQTGL